MLFDVTYGDLPTERVSGKTEDDAWASFCAGHDPVLKHPKQFKREITLVPYEPKPDEVVTEGTLVRSTPTQVVIKTNGDEKTFNVTENTSVSCDGKACAAESLKKEPEEPAPPTTVVLQPAPKPPEEKEHEIKVKVVSAKPDEKAAKADKDAPEPPANAVNVEAIDKNEEFAEPKKEKGKKETKAKHETNPAAHHAPK